MKISDFYSILTGLSVTFIKNNKTLLISMSSEIHTIPSELCFAVITSEDTENCSFEESSCAEPGTEMIIANHVDVIGVVSYGRGFCSDPTFANGEEFVKVTCCQISSERLKDRPTSLSLIKY